MLFIDGPEKADGVVHHSCWHSKETTSFSALPMGLALGWWRWAGGYVIDLSIHLSRMGWGGQGVKLLCDLQSLTAS